MHRKPWPSVRAARSRACKPAPAAVAGTACRCLFMQRLRPSLCPFCNAEAADKPVVLSTAVTAQHVQLRVLHPGILWADQAALNSLSYSAQLFATDGTTQKGSAVALPFQGSHVGTSEGDALEFQLPLT